MIIKVKLDKIVKVDVSSVYCPTFKCFSSYDRLRNKYLRCLHRDLHGCPEYPKKKEL